jgi:hypothetical protein
VEPKVTSTARQRRGKQVPAATDTQATIKIFSETMYFFGPRKEVIKEES